MSINWKSGDLAFIPSEVMMLKISVSGSVRRFIKTSKPKNALILKPHADIGSHYEDKYCEVLYNGENWYVKNTDIYGERNVDCAIS